MILGAHFLLDIFKIVKPFIFKNDVQFLTTFAQLSARLKNFLMGWLLVLGLKEGLVECAIVCVKSVVILNTPYLFNGLPHISFQQQSESSVGNSSSKTTTKSDFSMVSKTFLLPNSTKRCLSEYQN